VDADNVVQERLQFLRKEMRYLKSERDHAPSFQAHADNVRLRKAIECSLQLAVETCIDIVRRLIAVNGFRDPENNSDVFRFWRKRALFHTRRCHVAWTWHASET